MRLGGQSHFHGNAYASHAGATLEHLVLSNSKQFFKEYPQYPPQATDKWRTAAKLVGSEKVKLNGMEDEDESIAGSSNCCNKEWCWYSPPQGSVFVGFCNETTIHGFKFMGQPKRHFTERFFWLVAFFLSLGGAVYLIHNVWDRYQKLPVIVAFQANEQDIDSIPFPAVTLCNMNKFPKSKVKKLEEIAKDKYNDGYQTAKQQLTYVRSVCNAQQSFSKEFGFAFQRGATEDDANNDTIAEDSQDEMMQFLLSNTLPCDQLLRLCILGEVKTPCSSLFKPIITDYGKCCVFNILPLPLLLQNPQTKNVPNASMYDNPVLGNASHAEIFWPRHEIKDWQNWNYDDGFVLPKGSSKPWKQKRAGLPYGLSVLVDPHTEEYFCPVSDSEGIRYILHTPLEMPHVNEFASVADLGKEILIEVHPDMTNADDDIRNIEHEKRKCYFGKERTLKFFGPYTGGNCIDECTAIVLGEKCQCTFFFMPRDDGVRICNNDPDSNDFICIVKAQIDLQSTLKEKCGHCDALCEDIAYNYETTIATLQPNSSLWGDVDVKKHPNGPPDWTGHKMAIIHIFFGSETTVPKSRKRLYGTTDLIGWNLRSILGANTGGILGLCLGFSILSGVEVVYFLTLRSLWKFCRKRGASKKLANKFLKMFKPSNVNKVIRLNPKSVPIYSGYGQGYGAVFGGGGHVGYY